MIWELFRRCKVVLVVIGAMCALVCGSAAAETDYRVQWSRFAVSPDGSRIAYPVPGYDEYGDSATLLWVAKSDGSDAKQVGSLPGVWDLNWFGPDSLAATTFDTSRIPVLPVAGGEQKTLSLTEAYQWVQPAISPDSKWVAFSGVHKEPREVAVCLLDTASGKIRRLSSEVVKAYLTWSPDSKKIAYGVGAYQQHYKLMITDIETGAATDTGLDGVGVSWSPDGKSIAYTGNVVRGGSWASGIPVDGSVMVTNLDTKQSTVLTEPGVNVYDEKTKRWEIAGSYNPIWSPDGSKLAYRRGHTVRDGDKDTLREDEIWVVNADGSGKKRVSEKAAPFAWAPDGKAILVKGESEIGRIAVDSGEISTLVAWKQPEPPKVNAETPMTATAPGARVTYYGIKPEYAKALATLASEARSIYAERFGFDMPSEVTLEIEKDSSGRTSLWTDGDSGMFLTIKSGSDLKPPMQSGVFNIYGICHELGHVAMYRHIRMLGLPAGIGQGWADYTGSVVVDEVYKKSGKDLWPDPYDYSQSEGVARLKSRESDAQAMKSADTRAAVMFLKLQEKYGVAKVMAAMVAAEKGKPYGKDLMPRFVDALVKSTGDKAARAMVPEDMLTPKVEWNVAERDITDKTVEGLVETKDATGTLLKYDDGTSDGKRSTAGAGHAVVFKAPAGKWAVDYVEMFGSRYGTEVPPKDNFSIFICDKDFSVIKEIEKPYSLLERGDDKWYKLAFAPVKVPQAFYVCIYFNATASKGFYMNFDKSVSKSHSKSALPWTFVHDTGDDGKFDWMIRAHLVKGK